MKTWVAVADAVVSGQKAHPSDQEFINRLMYLIRYHLFIISSLFACLFYRYFLFGLFV